jgi:rubrerythrin
MEEPSVTASAIISFAQDVEDNSSAFYEGLARRFPNDKKTFLAFAQESRKNKTLIVRTYQETITDALEACFSFESLNLADYAIETMLPEDANWTDALGVAIELEDRARAFYLDVAEQSESLLATIPQVFKRVARKRDKRKLELRSLYDS